MRRASFLDAWTRVIKSSGEEREMIVTERVNGTLALVEGSFDDWWVIERAPVGRLLDADVEGTAEEMRGIAAAIRARGRYSAKRCAVDAREPDGVRLWSPRNSAAAALVDYAEADCLAVVIEGKLATPQPAASPDRDALEFDAFQAQAWARAGEHARAGDRVAMLYLALGLCGEAGEVGEVIKKCAGQQAGPLNVEKLKGELGDALWYLAMVARSAGVSLSEVAAAQIAKNHARYPAGFTREAAAARADEAKGG